MDQQESQSSERNSAGNSLHTYLRDHTAGAQNAVQLFEALAHIHQGTPLGRTTSELLQQVRDDLAVLEEVATHAGATGFQLYELAGWLGDKLSRLKLAPLDKPFHTFEALEFLSLGILGKRSLWKSLRLIAPQYAGLRSVDFDQLIARAEAQYSATEALRVQLALQAFRSAD